MRRAGLDPDWERVDDEAAFRAKLTANIDLVLSDFSMPQFDAMRALAILKETGLDIPFIIVSGTIGEKAAVDSMRAGAQDYIFKDNLSRLPAAAKRELEAAGHRKAGARAGQESAARLEAIIHSALDAVISMDDQGRIMGWNPHAESLFGWKAEEAVGRLLGDTIVPPALRAAHTTGLARYLATGEAHVLNRRIEVLAMHRDGREFPVELSIARLTVSGRPSFSGFIRDITDRLRHEKVTRADLAVTRVLAGAGALDEVLRNALEAIGVNLGWDVGQVWVLDESGRALRCRSQWIRPALPASDFIAERAADRYAQGEGLVGRVWANLEPVWLEDMTQASDPALVETAQRAGLRAAALMPLLAGSQFIGVAEFFSRERHLQDGVLLQFNVRIGELIGRAMSAAALKESDSRFRGLFYNVGVAKAIVALPGGLVLAINPAFSALLGYEPEEIIGKSGGIFSNPRGEAPSLMDVVAPSPASPAYQADAELRRKDGVLVWASLSVSTTFDEGGQPQNLLVQAHDITKSREAERALAAAQLELRHRAGHDALTELPNRIGLQEQLHELIHGPEGQISLVLLDLDHFREVNDFFGHLAGDDLLKQIGPRIQACLRRDDRVARIGGNEFGVILAGAGPAVATRLAETLLVSLAQPFTVQGQAIVVEASIGIATYPEDGTSTVDVMRRADIALHVAKRLPGTCVSYRPDFEGEGASHLTLMAELRTAIRDNTLSLYYQPLVDLRSGLVVRFEALLRWKHAVRGMVPPDQFIPFAEQTGVILPLTDWVLKNVLHQTHAWHEAGHDFGVAVNISMRNLMDAGLPDRVALWLQEFPASRNGAPLLSLEVTEGVVMADPVRAVERLSRLRRLGIRLSVDDFGTGYSSLAYLSRLPINEMKIDRSFISGIADDPSKAAVVRAALDLGHNLRLEVVAEGVEDQRTWDLLFVLGCDTVQGYYISRPMPAEAVIPWLLSSPYGGRLSLATAV